MDEHMDKIPNPHDMIRSAGEDNIAEKGRVKPISIRKVDLSDLLNGNSRRIKRWETNWDTHFDVRADPTIILFDQLIKPNREGEFMSYQEKAIANGRPEEAWSETLMTAVSHALYNAMQDTEGISSRRTARQVELTSHITESILTIEVKDNGQGIPEKTAKKLSPRYALKEERLKEEVNEEEGNKVGNRLGYIYGAIEQIGGRAELITKRTEDLKPGEASGTTLRFVFPANTSAGGLTA